MLKITISCWYLQIQAKQYPHSPRRWHIREVFERLDKLLVSDFERLLPNYTITLIPCPWIMPLLQIVFFVKSVCVKLVVEGCKECQVSCPSIPDNSTTSLLMQIKLYTPCQGSKARSHASIHTLPSVLTWRFRSMDINSIDSTESYPPNPPSSEF